MKEKQTETDYVQPRVQVVLMRLQMVGQESFSHEKLSVRSVGKKSSSV